MTPVEAALRVRRIKERLLNNVLTAERLTLADAAQQAARLSSGTASLASLRRRGYPYAVRRPAVANPELINAQSGRFRSAWKASGPKVRGGGLVSRLANASPEAKYMRGTRLMVPRPITEEIVRRVTPDRVRRLRTAVREALRG